MGFYDKLNGKINELREAAEQAFVDRYSAWNLGLDSSGRLEQVGVPGSDGRPGHEVLPGDEPVTQEWEAYRRSVIDLESRLTLYLDMGHHGIAPMSRYREELGGLAAGDSAPLESGTVFSMIQVAGDYLMDVRDLVTEEEWTGPAAADFQLVIGDPLQLALHLQKAYVQELSLGLNGVWKYVEQTREDLLKIVDAVLGAFRGPDVSLADVLNAISIGTTAAGLFTGGGWVPLTLGGVSLAGGLGSMWASGGGYEEEEWEIRRLYDGIGLIVQEVIASANEALDSLDRRIEAYDDYTSAGLDQDRIPAGPPPAVESISFDPAHPQTFILSDPCIKVARPTLNTGENFGEYTGNLKVELEDLREAGTSKLPMAADQLCTAAVYLNGMVLPTWLERFFPMVRASWEGCRSDLATVLGDAGTRFQEAGAALLDIAENYRDYDETAGQDVSATGS